MCFEFEALYWAKLAEEEEQRREIEKQRAAAQAQQRYHSNLDEEPLPA